jgi:hypothetical protein
MAEHKIVYLLVEKGTNGNKKTYWRVAGVAYPCRDDSLNLKLDIHPGLTFNIRSPKSLGELEETDIETEEDDHLFPCTDCKIVTSNDQAHFVHDGAVVCDKCHKKYKDCGRCGAAIPKTFKGSCLNCGVK